MTGFDAADPRGWQRRLGLDRGLAVAFFIVMMDRLTENPWHEWLAAAAGAAALFHVAINRSWWTRLLRRRRRFSAALWFERVVTLILTVTFVAAWVSGALVSQTVFAAVTPFAWQQNLDWRAAHVAWSVLFFLAAGLHAGVKLPVLLGVAPGFTLWRAVIAVVLAATGAGAFLSRGFPELLSFEAAYVTVERGEWAGAMPLDFAVVFLGTAAAAFLLQSALKRFFG